MRDNKVDAGTWVLPEGIGMQIHVAIVWTGVMMSLLATADMTAKGAEGASDFVTPGEPQVLFIAGGDWTSGYWTSLAFTQDSKSLVGTLERNPGSAALFLLGQRVGEVRSFDVTAKDKNSTLLMTARNAHYQILTTPSGVCREPLLLARSDGQLKEIEVVDVRPTTSGSDESLIGRFPIPRNENMSPHADCSIRLAVTPVKEKLVLGTGCSEWREGAHSATWWGDVKAFDLRTGESRFADAWEGNQVLAVACSSDGTFIAAAGGHSAPTPHSPNRYDGRVVCWEDTFQKRRFDLALPSHQVHCLVFSPDSTTLVTGGLDGRVKWIDLTQGIEVKSLDIASRSGKNLGRIECLAFSPNGKLLAAGTGSWNRGNKWGETFLVDLRDDGVHKIPSSQENHVISCVAFSPDGKYLATGGMEGILKLWQIDGRQ